uniref:Uncharacterized protein n=1 Tax=Rhizophagus irregularis (strain DAOM 181602 / DAOM 197198 / MUCL 43194) TaxID=747089 RepID=U9TF31_RHIID
MLGLMPIYQFKKFRFLHVCLLIFFAIVNFYKKIFGETMLPQFPPPPAIYNSADELYHNAQTFRTRKDRHGELKNITLRCDRGGVYNNSLGLMKEHIKYKDLLSISTENPIINVTLTLKF